MPLQTVRLQCVIMADIVDRESYERLTAAYPALDAMLQRPFTDPFLIEHVGAGGTERERTQNVGLVFHQQVWKILPNDVRG